MGRVSKRVINKALRNEIEDQLSFIISALKNKDEINSFLDEFLTREEKIMLGKRLILYMMLYKDMSNVDINNSLSVSYETVRSYRNVFKSKQGTFKKRINKLIAREQNKLLWDKIEKILEPVSLALTIKTNMKSRAKLMSRDY